MKAFFYHVPTTLQEATGLLGREARPLAGGTDLLTLMKGGIAEPAHLIAIRRLLAAGIAEEGGAVAIGAGATLADIERHPMLKQQYAALAQAAALAATPQLRNMATLGGNLLQRPRCWYFRNAHVHCWLKGGEECQARDGQNRQHALFGEGPCVAVHPSDPAAALVAFDAAVRVLGPRGERVVPIAQFLALPEEERRTETRLAEDELVTGIRMPTHPEETRSVYLKAMDRQAFSFALVGVAAALRLSSRGRIAHARVVLSGVAPVPWRAAHAEAVLLDAEPEEETFEKAAAAALDGAAPLAHNAWKIRLGRALVKRALEQLA